MELDLQLIQAQHRDWINYNFPGEKGNQAILGMMEELGELCHAVLKGEQGIRGMMTPHQVREAVIDAHCDLIIFSLTLADEMGYDLAAELQKTWAKVQQRDWVTDPENGGTNAG